MNKKLSPDILVTRKKYNIIRKYPSPNEKQLPFPNISMNGRMLPKYTFPMVISQLLRILEMTPITISVNNPQKTY